MGTINDISLYSFSLNFFHRVLLLKVLLIQYGNYNSLAPYLPSSCGFPPLKLNCTRNNETLRLWGICSTQPNRSVSTEGVYYGYLDLLQKSVTQRFQPNHTTVVDAEPTCGDCSEFSGVCVYDRNSTQVFCDCSANNQTSGSTLKHYYWILGVLVAIFGVAVISILIIYFSKSKREQIDVEDFITLKRYTYASVKRMANSFAEKIGEGGYSIVYKGQLSNGSSVAVKVLKEAKGNGEDFINEVASIGAIMHNNVVRLLGFCYEGNKRALIYEYMPRGSLNKFIFNTKISRLEWKRLYEIAIGIARGLKYLHQDCAATILHFDIKPHNILLDSDFCPKISDFGLAKLCQGDGSSSISLLGARGTAGYTAPEMYNRNFGEVSYKSDVYSYGMMVLEMVGGRKNIDTGVSRTSEIYYPYWAHKHIDDDGGGERLKNICEEMVDEDNEMLARKMINVSLWCIQAKPSNRPSMSEVIQMMEGSLQSLQMPPKPTLSLQNE
ncbi:PR5-like receptor kinase isoform X2 [Humulus lupulus]|uniref:PR5-like receptor kinase isoform X2 n=1 Tax=Humulus lupulus TaxID=3486 RepID=UPI002B404DB6|nr:PR5-like receptor kinase isoform X2 [Humulus lupulus]